jgi:hypothetical protein
MAPSEPVSELDARYGEEGVSAVPWSEAERALATAELSWLSTVRPDGQPHVTPLITAWHDGALWVTTGPEEQKARNLAANPRCTLTTGCNALHEGLDLVVEGTAVRETDDGRLREVAAAFEAKYGDEWHFDVAGGAFHHGPGEAHVFEVRPVTAYGFGKAPYATPAGGSDPRPSAFFAQSRSPVERDCAQSAVGISPSRGGGSPRRPGRPCSRRAGPGPAPPGWAPGAPGPPGAAGRRWPP